MRRHWLAVAALSLLAVPSLDGRAAAQPRPEAIKPAAIATATGHPGPLTVEHEATSELSKGFGTPLWAVGITSADGSFGHVAVLLVAHGSFLHPEMIAPLRAAAADPKTTAAAIRADLQGQRDRATLERDRNRLTEQLAELDAILAHGPMTRVILPPFEKRGPGGVGKIPPDPPFSKGGSDATRPPASTLQTPAPATPAAGSATPPAATQPVGFVTVLGFAASGATFVAALPSPDQRYELLVVTGGSLEGEEKRKTTSASAAYETAMREHPLDVTEAIARTIYGQLFATKD